MDISAVTVPSVLAKAFESNVRLVFGTDIDFALTERGKYVMFKIANGERVLADDEDNGSVITALVSTNFGDKLKPFAAKQGIDLDAPLILFQMEGILDAIGRIERNGRTQEEIRVILEDLFFRNAQRLFGI